MTRTSGLTGAPPATWPRGGAAESRRRSHRRPHATVGRQLELAAGPAGTIVRGDPGLRRHGRADGTGCRAHDARTSRSGSTRRRRPGPRRSPAASTTHRDDRRQPRPHTATIAGSLDHTPRRSPAASTTPTTSPGPATPRPRRRPFPLESGAWYWIDGIDVAPPDPDAGAVVAPGDSITATRSTG